MHTGKEGRKGKQRGDSPSRIITTADTSHITVIETSATLTDLPRQREELPQIEAAANTHTERKSETNTQTAANSCHSLQSLTHTTTNCVDRLQRQQISLAHRTTRQLKIEQHSLLFFPSSFPKDSQTTEATGKAFIALTFSWQQKQRAV